jgi:hypothetical protein
MADLLSPNFLQPTGFKLVIDRAQFGNLEFFANQVTHPSIDIGETLQPFRGVDAHFPGDKIQYAQMSAEVMLDEDMKVYEELHSWLLRTQDKQVNAVDTTTSSGLKTTYDMQMLVLTSHNNQVRSFKYKDAFPTSLGTVNFTAATGTVQAITVPVTFSYSQFDFS